MSAIAEGKNRLDNLAAAAGVNHIGSAIDHSAAGIERANGNNYTGAFTSATAAAAQILDKECRGSILLVSSMSGVIANKGMRSSMLDLRFELFRNKLFLLNSRRFEDIHEGVKTGSILSLFNF